SVGEPARRGRRGGGRPGTGRRRPARPRRRGAVAAADRRPRTHPAAVRRRRLTTSPAVTGRRGSPTNGAEARNVPGNTWAIAVMCLRRPGGAPLRCAAHIVTE